MKKSLLLCTCIVATVQFVFGRSEVKPKMDACRNVEFGIGVEFLSKGKDLPATWNEIPGIRRMKEEMPDQNPLLLRNINNLAIVPGAPEIQAEGGVRRDHQDLKLFAVSRTRNFDSALEANRPEGGRYAILIDPKIPEAVSVWIPEPEIGIILRQIKGFDPEKQPLAFGNVDQIEREQKERKEKFFNESREARNNQRNSRKGGNSTFTIVTIKCHWLLLVLGASIVVILLAWLFLKFKKP